jgi:hypothetical protein
MHQQKQDTKTHVVIDSRTNQIVSKPLTAKSARTKADNLDNNYGGYRYFARPIEQAVIA